MNLDEQEPQRLTAVVERARSRVLANHALCEAALGGSIALLGPTLFLLLGRRWIDWPALVVFALAGLGVALWRLFRRRPDLYRVAQALDARLGSDDQISTAIHFLAADSPVAVEQRRRAARLAEISRVEAAFPFTVPRSLYGLASVFLIASTLWAIRYFLEKPLRLDQPLAQVISQALRGGELPPPEQGPAAEQETVAAAQRQPAASPNENPEFRDPQGEPQAQDASAAGSDGADKDGRKPEDAEAGSEGIPSDEIGDPIVSDADSDAIQSYEEMLERDAKSGLAKAEGKQGKDGDSNANRPDGNGSQEANSLLSKLREAMNNMLSRLGQKPQGPGPQQQAAGGSQSDGAEQQDGQGEGRSGAGQPQPGGQAATEGEGSDGESGDKNAQNSAGKNSAKSAEGGSKGASGDGAGQQDGDKRLLQAQQEEILGKLSELYGRRAANVTGEVTVEAQSGKQTLRTPHASKQARHRDSGGEVSRDEIPLAYQAYIKEYFSKLRQSDKE